MKRKIINSNNWGLSVSGYCRKIINRIFNYFIIGRTDIFFDSRSKILGLKYMKIGHNFSSGKGLWLEAVSTYNGTKLSPQIIIGNDVSLSEYNHIGATHHIKIGNNVLIGSKCYITDHNHGIYAGEKQSDIDVPPIKRELTSDGFVTIEDNVWLGDNVVVLPNVTIGYGSIIGAGAIVTKSIPAECIAVGAPAHVIKRWNRALKIWENVN